MRRAMWIAAFVAGFLAAAPANAQQYTLVVRGVPLDRALEQLAYTTGIDLVYTSFDVRGKQAYCNGRNLPAAGLLECVLKGSGLDYVRSSSGSYILIDAVAAAPRFGHLAGAVVDADTGEPLPYANVLLADAGTGTSTDQSGLFSFASVLTGPHRLVVTYVGYESESDSVWIDPGSQHRIQVALRSAEATLAPVVVNGLTQRLPSSGLGSPARSADRIRSTQAAATSDVTRGLTSITGVAAQQPLADLHIQGGGAGEHATLLDGVPVRDPVSLGRYLSAFSPLALGRITIHKAGFGAQAGSNLAGVVDVEHDVSGGDRLAASIDPVSINGRVESRFLLSNGIEGAVMAAARSSVWNAYHDPAVAALLESWHAVDPMIAGEYPNASSLAYRRPDVAFSDLHAATRLKLSPFRTLHASAYRAGNRLAADYASTHEDEMYEQRTLLTHDVYDWTNWVGQIRHSWLIGARAAVSTQLLGSWNYADYAYYGLYQGTASVATISQLRQLADDRRSELLAEPSADEENYLRELAWRTRATYSLSSRHHVDAELTAQHTSSRFNFHNPHVVPIAHADDAWQLLGSVEGRHSIGLGTVVEPGLRLTYVPERSTVYAEPRLAIRHDASLGPLGTGAVRLAGGVYRQFVNQLDVTSSGATSLVPTSMVWLPLDGSMAPARAYHLAAEALLMPSPEWTVTAEAYRKWQPRLLMLDYAAIANTAPSTSPAPLARQRHFLTAGSGDVYGASLRLERAGARLNPTISYNYVHARRTYPARFEEKPQPVPWSAPHRVTADLEADLGSRLKALLTWDAAWGRTWALRRAYYDYPALGVPASDRFDPADPSSSRLAPYHRIDAGVSYGVDWGEFGAELRLFVTNVTGRRNVYDVSLADGLDPLPRTLPGRHLFASIRVAY